VRVMALTLTEKEEGGLVRSLREEGVRRLRRVEALKNEEERDRDAIVGYSIQFNSKFHTQHTSLLSHLFFVFGWCLDLD